MSHVVIKKSAFSSEISMECHVKQLNCDNEVISYCASSRSSLSFRQHLQLSVPVSYSWCSSVSFWGSPSRFHLLHLIYRRRRRRRCIAEKCSARSCSCSCWSFEGCRCKCNKNKCKKYAKSTKKKTQQKSNNCACCCLKFMCWWAANLSWQLRMPAETLSKPWWNAPAIPAWEPQYYWSPAYLS